MKLQYYPETDSLYMDLNTRPSAESREIADGLVVDFDAEGNIVGGRHRPRLEEARFEQAGN